MSLVFESNIPPEGGNADGLHPVHTSACEIQPRDLRLMSDLLDARLMTAAHAAAIHFDGRIEATKKRLQKLSAAGFIVQRRRKPYEPSVYALARPGLAVLHRHGLLDGLPQRSWKAFAKRRHVSELTLAHELAVQDVKAAFHTGIRGNDGLTITEFSAWPLRYQFRAAPAGGPDILVKPDAFLRVHERDGASAYEHVYYLEIDRGTETLDTLAQKAVCYVAHYRCGGLAERFGFDASEYKRFPFRVLMTFKTAERRNNLAALLLEQHPPIYTQVWLSTFAEVTTDPLGSIWTRPRDYADLVDEAPQLAKPLTASHIYRRSSERDRQVEATIQKLKLFNT